MISVLITVIVRYAGSRPELIEEEGRDEVVALAARASPNLAFYVVVLALALLAQGRRVRFPRDRRVRDPGRR